MEKVIELVERAPGMDRARFGAEIVAAYERFAALAGDGLARCTVGVRDVDPASVGLGANDLPYNAVVELWLADGGAYRPAPEVAAGVAGTSHAYRVTERTIKDESGARPAGTVTPGIKTVFPIYRLATITAAEYDDHWRTSHGPLAKRVHVGMSKYVQSTVVEVLTPGAPGFDGFTETFFPTAEDHRDRFFGSPEGAAAIRADVAQFVSSAYPLPTTEHVVK